jgi:hypothetical protein
MWNTLSILASKDRRPGPRPFSELYDNFYTSADFSQLFTVEWQRLRLASIGFLDCKTLPAKGSVQKVFRGPAGSAPAVGKAGSSRWQPAVGLLPRGGGSGEGVRRGGLYCSQGLEGIVAKRLESRYWPGKRWDAWIKIKQPTTVPLTSANHPGKELALPGLMSRKSAGDREGNKRSSSTSARSKHRDECLRDGRRDNRR